MAHDLFEGEYELLNLFEENSQDLGELEDYEELVESGKIPQDYIEIAKKYFPYSYRKGQVELLMTAYISRLNAIVEPFNKIVEPINIEHKSDEKRKNDIEFLEKEKKILKDEIPKYEKFISNYEDELEQRNKRWFTPLKI
jgi:predicted ribosome quality control (RQC) complex YloA/Tae2 family protein